MISLNIRNIMATRTITVLLISTLSLVNGEGTFDRLCSRIFMGSKAMGDPYVNLLNGVYVKTDQVIDKFPVYVYERGGAYFQYSTKEGIFFFSVHGTGYINYAGVFAQSDKYLMEDPQRWLSRINNKTDLFGSALKEWYTTNPNAQKEWRSYGSIYPKCVDFTDCGNGDLQFLMNITYTIGERQLNDPTVDYFRPIPNTFREFRSVYKHSNFAVTGWYLFYYEDWKKRGRWQIGPNYDRSDRYWEARDEALKAEFITSYWQQWTGRTWKSYDESVKMQCRGMAGVRCSEKPSSICSEDFADRAVCTCPIGLTGNYCLTEEKTCDATTTRASMQINSAYGSVATKICKQGFKNIICQQDPTLSKLRWTGDSCPGEKPKPQPRPRPRPRPRPTPKPFNFDKRPFGLRVTLYLSTLFLPLLLPFIQWGVTKLRGERRSFARLLSMYTWVFGCLDIVIVILYATNYLQKYGQETFRQMYMMALISLGGCYLWNCIESFFSHEKSYFSASFDTDDVGSYIQSLVRTKPTLSTEVRCWHSETRYRTVTYRDSDGFQRSRQESYQEAVTTWEGSEAYEYCSWIDLTNQSAIPKFDETRMTRLKLGVDIRFKDEPTRLDFLVKQKMFVDSNRWRDTSTNFKTLQQIEGLIERSTLYGKNYTRPCWVSKGYYWLCVALFMTWPYRFLLRLHCKHVECTFVKEISNTESCAPTAPSDNLGSEKEQLCVPPGWNMYGATNTGYVAPPMVEMKQ